MVMKRRDSNTVCNDLSHEQTTCPSVYWGDTRAKVPSHAPASGPQGPSEHLWHRYLQSASWHMMTCCAGEFLIGRLRCPQSTFRRRYSDPRTSGGTPTRSPSNEIIPEARRFCRDEQRSVPQQNTTRFCPVLRLIFDWIYWKSEPSPESLQ